ncbi:MAG: thioredoxin [Lentisphaeria bacterium]|nr:thioredoxin [Lentisphaeria bacterium]
MAAIRNIGAEEFDAAVAKGVVLTDFWAPWCSSCKMLGTILEQAAKDVPDSVTIVKIDVDGAQQLAAKLGVGTLPTLILYKDGAAVKTVVGMQSRAKLVDMLTNA